jgi:hypothetical protein
VHASRADLTSRQPTRAACHGRVINVPDRYQAREPTQRICMCTLFLSMSTKALSARRACHIRGMMPAVLHLYPAEQHVGGLNHGVPGQSSATDEHQSVAERLADEPHRQLAQKAVGSVISITLEVEHGNTGGTPRRRSIAI